MRTFKRRALGTAMVGFALAGWGCGSSAPLATSAGLSTPPPSATRRLTLIQDIVQEAGASSGLGSQHAGLRVSFFDASATEVGQRQVLDRTSITTSAQSLIPGLPAQLPIDAPISATEVGINYLGVDGSKTGDTHLTLPAGDTLELVGNPAAPVYFGKAGGQYQLIVNDRPMVVKGVGFDYALGTDSPAPGDSNWFSYVDPDIARASANVIRTYGVGWNFATPQVQAQNLSAMLKFATANSTPQKPIMVLAGLVFDPGQGDMSVLIPQTVALVANDPNYANLLGWVVGNENPPSQYPQIDSAVRQIKASMTTDDKVRLVTHAVPNVSSGQVAVLQQSLPSIDCLGINTFYGQFDNAHKGGGFLNTQAAELAKGGWSKPWLITEYYSYDLPAPSFGSVAGMPSQLLNGQPYYLELNSTLNAANYTRSYQDYIVSPDALSKGSVGGMALNWGPPHNSKLIAFWKSTYAYRGEFKPFVNPPYSESGIDRLECAFAVADIYGGSLGANRPPQIVLPSDGDPQGIDCNFKATVNSNPTLVAAGTTLTASVLVKDNDPLTFDWYLVGGTAAGFPGDITAAQKDPMNYTNTTTLRLGGGTSQAVTEGTRNTISFQLPAGSAPGNNYQLRAVARDGQGGAATACIGFPTQ